MMTSNQIRQSFLDFFASKQHHIVSSAPVIPQQDPTLLFTNAGMNQFKDIFLGTAKPVHKRVADSQKCIRVSGKHNDLEEVGRDTYHHTFFEMLGNWSFGDYFKAEAIQWAWELLTDVWGLPKDKLYATVFAGDPKDKVDADEEAEQIWQKHTDINPQHIRRFGKKDNFWEMGETGPCGPCSEIHLDRGPEFCDKHDPHHQCDVNAGCARYIELWNLVFIQYNRDDQGRLHLLPSKHVDTGAGFERICSVLQKKSSNYDVDLFQPIIAEISRLTGKPYGDGEEGVAFRVLCDHIRSLTFAITDGALPGNDGRGYVLRRILRRAARFGRVLEMQEPFIYRLVAPLAESMGDAYPEIRQRQDYVRRVILAEEEGFGRTLDRGLEIFNVRAQEALQQGKVFSGVDAFVLHDTYGFPLDLTQLMAQEKNLTVDVPAFEREMEQQRERSSKAQDNKYATIGVLAGAETGSLFVGYDQDEVETKIIHGEEGRLVLKHTPFYAESGGQVGDSGIISGADCEFIVADTKRVGEHIVHFGRLSKGVWPPVGASVTAVIDRVKRRATERNHTVTHLTHKALRMVLGEHVHQSGSYVAPLQMRFDFSHFEKVSPAEVQAIEDIVNEQIQNNRQVAWREMSLDKAKELGAMALFGEKYGDQVRMVEVDGFSRELCGGTHVHATGEIGAFVITAESAVAAGMRRIECATAMGFIDHVRQQQAFLHDATVLLACRPDELNERMKKVLDERKALELELRKLRQQSAAGEVDDLLNTVQMVKGVQLIAAPVQAANVDELRQMGDLLREKMKSGVAVLAMISGDKANFLCTVSKDIIDGRKLKAGDIVKQVAALAGGSGGGQPHMALAGAKEIDKVKPALAEAAAILAKMIKSEQV
jgi:alanyl-tRNA synthetase